MKFTTTENAFCKSSGINFSAGDKGFILSLYEYITGYIELLTRACILFNGMEPQKCRF